MSRSWSRWHTKIFPQPSSSPFLPLPCSMVCIFQAVNCPHLRRQYMFNECFSCICIGFSEFNKPAMCRISHCHFFSIMLFVLPFRTEHSTYFILSKVCHLWVDWSINLFIYYEGLRDTLHRILTMWIKSKTLCIKLNPWTFLLFVKQGTVHD